jgi:hypothetical protein
VVVVLEAVAQGEPAVVVEKPFKLSPEGFIVDRPNP